jgi:hypothetical protein
LAESILPLALVPLIANLLCCLLSFISVYTVSQAPLMSPATLCPELRLL